MLPNAFFDFYPSIFVNADVASDLMLPAAIFDQVGHHTLSHVAATPKQKLLTDDRARKRPRLHCNLAGIPCIPQSNHQLFRCTPVREARSAHLQTDGRSADILMNFIATVRKSHDWRIIVRSR
jgi:hypothetical protein